MRRRALRVPCHSLSRLTHRARCRYAWSARRSALPGRLTYVTPLLYSARARSRTLLAHFLRVVLLHGVWAHVAHGGNAAIDLGHALVPVPVVRAHLPQRRPHARDDRVL